MSDSKNTKIDNKFLIAIALIIGVIGTAIHYALKSIKLTKENAFLKYQNHMLIKSIQKFNL